MSGAPPAGVPSVLAPAGTEAATLGELSVVLLVGAAVIFVLTMALLAWSLRRRPKAAVATGWWIVGGGIALPVLVLSGLLLYGTVLTAALERPPADPPLVVSVTGRMWWWEVRYRLPGSEREVVLANELRLPVGRSAHIALASADVIHSFWVPELGGKRDLTPGRLNHLVVTPSQAGTFRGQCAEFCGLQHAKMALHVVALPPEDFERWLAQQAQPASAPEADASPQASRGRLAFVEQGCAACHTVRGTFEGARRGPDLTHVASRIGLGAGALPNTPGAARRWLHGVQEIKPGARMPSYAHLDAATLDALAAYLEQLR